jgi:hypothetical protein
MADIAVDDDAVDEVESDWLRMDGRVKTPAGTKAVAEPVTVVDAAANTVVVLRID